MKAVITIQQHGGQTYWIAQRCCLSLEEAKAGEAVLDAMPWPTAYLPPETEALLERAEAAEADLPDDMGLLAGGAYRCANGVGVGD